MLYSSIFSRRQRRLPPYLAPRCPRQPRPAPPLRYVARVESLDKTDVVDVETVYQAHVGVGSATTPRGLRSGWSSVASQVSYY